MRCTADNVEVELPSRLAAELLHGEAVGATRLLVYFVTEGGEVIPDEHELDVERALRSTLSVTVASGSSKGDGTPDYFLPGSAVDITIKTSSSSSTAGSTSLVGLAAIDTSVLLLRDQKALSADTVLANQAAAAASPQSNSKYADQIIQNAGLVFLSSKGIFAPSDPYDTNVWDQRGGGGIMEADGIPMVAMADDPAGMPPPPMAAPPGPPVAKGASNAEPARTRAHFPETWSV